MAELGRLRRSRSAHRNVLNGLIVKVENLMKEGPGEGVNKDITATLRLVKVIANINDKILDSIAEDDIEIDVEQCANFDLKISKNLLEIENYVKKRTSPATEVKPVVKHGGSGDVPSSSNKGVKLPKIVIKKFIGDPITWRQFEETFDATVNQNKYLTDIEKFSYLKGYLSGAAEKCIEGLMLTNENYKEALALLRERFGNPQLIIASHINSLLKMEKVNLGRNSKSLCSLYDQVEGHVRALHTAGVNSNHYGTLLILLILERLPDEIRLEICRKLGTQNWQIDPFMNILKEEINAREN